MLTKPRRLTVALVLLALPAAGAPPAAPSGAAGDAGPRAAGEGLDPEDGVVMAMPMDCPAAGSGAEAAEVRRSVDLTTRLFAASHAAPPGGPVSPGDPLVPASHVVPVNYVDEEIFGAMEAAGVRPAPPSSDEEFLRRVTLDLTGRIPDAATVKAFVAEPPAGKRDRVIDALLASDAFVDRWAQFYDDLFKVTAFPSSGRLGVDARNAYHGYVVDAVRSHKPWDVMARELIAADGNNGPGSTKVTVTAPTNFEVRNIQANGPVQDTYDNLAASTGSAFLGVNIFCTSCHSGAGHTNQINLWLTSLGRADFWGMSAFYARTTFKRQDMNPTTYYQVGEAASGSYQLGTTTGNKTPRDGKVWANGATSITPKFVLTGETPAKGEGYRAAMARLVTSHPQFARAAVNYLWKQLFVLGIVEPPDGFDLLRQDPASPPPAPWTIQPTHPKLLRELADDFAASGYDLRSILRTMVRSRAYQLSSSYPGSWSESATPLFARHFVRRLRAEEVLDAVTAATGVGVSLTVQGTTSPVAFAAQLPDVVGEPSGPSARYRPFLDAFLRGDRDTVARSSEGSISQALSMMNDRTVTDRVKASAAGSAVAKLVAAKADPATVVTTLYLSTLSRSPSPSEKDAAVKLLTNLAPGQTAASAAEDLQFALLNKLDFLFDY